MTTSKHADGPPIWQLQIDDERRPLAAKRAQVLHIETLTAAGAEPFMTPSGRYCAPASVRGRVTPVSTTDAIDASTAAGWMMIGRVPVQ